MRVIYAILFGVHLDYLIINLVCLVSVLNLALERGSLVHGLRIAQLKHSYGREAYQS